MEASILCFLVVPHFIMKKPVNLLSKLAHLEILIAIEINLDVFALLLVLDGRIQVRQYD